MNRKKKCLLSITAMVLVLLCAGMFITPVQACWARACGPKNTIQITLLYSDGTLAKAGNQILISSELYGSDAVYYTCDKRGMIIIDTSVETRYAPGTTWIIQMYNHVWEKNGEFTVNHRGTTMVTGTLLVDYCRLKIVVQHSDGTPARFSRITICSDATGSNPVSYTTDRRGWILIDTSVETRYPPFSTWYIFYKGVINSLTVMWYAGGETTIKG